MGNILKRIKSISDLEGISISALETAIGASKGVLSRALLNGTDIQSKWIQLIYEKYPHYSAKWLLTGQKPMLDRQGSAVSVPEEGDGALRADQDKISEALNLTVTAQNDTIASLKEAVSSQKDAIEALKTNLALLEKSQKTKESSKKANKPAPPVMPSLF